MIKINLHTLDVEACRYRGICSGCPQILLEPANQLLKKKNAIRSSFEERGISNSLLETLTIDRPQEFGFREHADLTLHRVNGKTRIGLYNREKRHIVDLETCPLMTADLASWYKQVRGLLPSIQFGHFRIRTAPDGTRGIWLDFPNRVLSYFLDEKRFLKRLCEHAKVEIGQKHHRITFKNGHLLCDQPKLHPWFETYIGHKLRPTPLFSHIGGFAQPGRTMNSALISQLKTYLEKNMHLRHWIELGSGTGNFTLPLASMGFQVSAIEMHPLAIRGLRQSLSHAGLCERVEVIQTNFHQPPKKIGELFKANSGMLLDPPRSGMGSFIRVLERLESINLPNVILYISCFAESLARDTKSLNSLGYELKSIRGLDQFPHSHHCEWIACFSKLSPSQ